MTALSWMEPVWCGLKAIDTSQAWVELAGQVEPWVMTKLLAACSATLNGWSIGYPLGSRIVNVCDALIVFTPCGANCRSGTDVARGQYDVVAVTGMDCETPELTSVRVRVAVYVPTLVELNEMALMQAPWGATERQLRVSAVITAAFGPVKVAERLRVVEPVFVTFREPEALLLLLGSGAVGE